MNAFFSSLSPARKSMILLTIIYIGFISLGLPDSVLGVAWNDMRIDFAKPVAYAGLITMLLTCCSAVSSFSSGYILRKLGTGRLLMICGFVTGLSLLGYAWAPAFWCLLLLTIPLGFGQGAVDTGMNYYVAKHYSSRDMNWLHCCWGVGASGGPGLMTGLLAAGICWRWGYVILGGIQLSLALLFLATLGLWREPEVTEETVTPDVKTKSAQPVQKNFRFWCCPAMFFLYCGAEASLGLWGFMFLTEVRGLPVEVAGFAITGYWGMLTLGRLVIGFFANKIGNVRQIRYSMVLALGCGILMIIPGVPLLSLTALVISGFALACFYPAMMHAAPERFNDATAATIIGFQGGGAMIGVAVIPAAFGLVATHCSFLLLPYLLMLATVIILLLQYHVDGRGRKSC